MKLPDFAEAGTKRKEVSIELDEPFITAFIVENRTKQKVEYVRKAKNL